MGRRRVLFLLLFLLVAQGAWAQVVSLDGTEWRVKVRPSSKWAGWWNFHDKLIFERGKFSSTLCVDSGFQEAFYEVNAQGNISEWKSMLVNAKNEKSRWEGKAEGSRIRGTMRVEKRNGEVKLYYFKGKKLASS